MDSQIPDDLSKWISNEVHMQIHHEMDHALKSPEHVNRMVGEAMRHIGSTLSINSTGYLPLRAEEMLAKPALMAADSNDAVVLVLREVHTENSFSILAKRTTNGDRIDFDLTAFKADPFNLAQTKFLTLPQAVGNEIIRQLNLIVKTDGVCLVQAVTLKNFFPSTAAPDQPDLFTPQPEAAAPAVAAAPAPAAEPQAGGLPAVVIPNEVL